MHPRDRRRTIDRRRFLQLAATGLVAAPSAAAMLAACRPSSSRLPSEGSYPVARRDAPVELPIDAGLPTLADGRPEESGPLRVFGWPLYIRPSVLRDFEERYNTTVEWTSFDTMNEALARLRAGGDAFDLFFPTADLVGVLARGNVLQPLNHSYISHADALWEEFQSPFYDAGSHYSMPYVVWTTGIAWRNDLVDGPRGLQNPYSIFWDSRLRGGVHLLAEPRDVIGMTLLRNGILDVNTQIPSAIEAAKEDLLTLVDLVEPSFDHLDYKDLYSGEVLVHQSWSGNMAFADGYAPKPSDVATLSYWWPGRGGAHPGLVGSDTMAVLRAARNPVLAHRLIDMMLEPDVALRNVEYEGYQQPLTDLRPERMLELAMVPESLADVPTTREDFARGLPLMELTPQADELWQLAWDEVTGAQERTAAIV